LQIFWIQIDFLYKKNKCEKIDKLWDFLKIVKKKIEKL